MSKAVFTKAKVSGVVIVVTSKNAEINREKSYEDSETKIEQLFIKSRMTHRFCHLSL